MEALLPSEISRLVLGFIEEQNCTEAAKLFLETCPHLKECAAAAQSGRKFGTQVYGKNLVNILDEYTLIHSTVQERIQELPDNAALQLKSTCGNFLPDQVKHLLNGKSAGQRFHVNITVPTQVAVPQSNITSLGGLISNSSQCHQRSKSRIVGTSPASTRPRRTTHLLQEKRLTLRSQDSLEDVTASVTVQRIEATHLQNLTGSLDRGNVTRDVGDAEEENDSLLDPKTGEFISPCNKSCSVKNDGFKTGPVDAGVTLSTNNQNKALCSDEAGKLDGEEQMFGRTSSGRTSLDKLVSDILACHEAEEKRENEVKHPSGSLPREKVASETCTASCLEESMKAALTPSNKNVSSLLHQSPTEAQKGVHESYSYTPKRSGAKRKAKPTPLKMITPLKSKAAPEVLDPSEVVVDPKFFIGPLLDNRQLHEKIAENINQLIWPCGAEAEVAEEQTPEASATSLPPPTSGENVMHQELEKAIKTVVDKTEADPLFERLLNEILGPEYEEENSVLGDKNESEMVLNAKTPEGRKGMTPLSLEDQNEEAINSILKVQPMEEESKPSGGLCKDKVHSVKIVKGRPSGACKSIFSEVTGRRQGKTASGTNHPIDHDDKNRTQVNKLVLVPINDVLGPPLSFPRVNINGIEQYIVPMESLNSIPVVMPLAPSGSETQAPVNQFIFRKATSEDLKNMTNKPIVLPINSTELTPIAPPSTKPSFFHLLLQDNLQFATSTPSTSAGFIQIPVAENSQNNSELSKTAEGHSIANTKESETENNKTVKGPNPEKESTPTVINSRPERAVTEGRLPILEPPRATPLMTIGGRRASLSTPRRSRSSGHVRALDFGSTPPSKQMFQDSPFAVSNLSQEEPKHNRQSAAAKTMRKDLQKVLETSDKLPDPSACIATRSPPPRLSKAWNKVGVDLIFGGGTSPNEMSSPAPDSGLEVESKTNESEVRMNKKSISTEEACQWESPKLRLKGTWDADLRAIVSSAEFKPKLTKKQQREKERKERALKKAEEAAKKKNTKQEVNRKEGEGTKGSSGQKGLGKGEAAQESFILKDENLVEEKSTEEIICEDAREEDNLAKKGKQKKRSKGEHMQKKKVAPKKSLEKMVPTVDANDSLVSPEKIWVVQQSPGSLATKRSIHEVTQNLLDSESGKWPGSARKHLDLQETPRKSDPSVASLRRFCAGEDIHSTSACDRTTLTVVETPLFPMTPNINLLNTPNGQDCREFAETFPSYYKPSALEITEKESVLEDTVISKHRQEGETREDIFHAEDTIAGSSKVNGSNIDEEMDVEEGFDNCKKKNARGKVSAKKRRQNCKARKPVVRKSGKQIQTKNVCVSSKKELVDEEEEQQPERRVLRPRKSKTSYVEEPLEDKGKRNNRSKKKESDEDYPLSVFQKKSAKPEEDSIEIGSTPEPLSKESQKIFDSMASEEEQAQTQEAEMLARSISLKLSPLCPKTTLLEEEESDEDSVASDGPVIRRTPIKPKPIIHSSSSSSSDSDSNSSSSYSSDMSSDEDSRPSKMSPKSNVKSLNVNQSNNEISHALEVNVNNSQVMESVNSEPIKTPFPIVGDCPGQKPLYKAQNLTDEVVMDAGDTSRNETVEKSNLTKHQNDRNLEKGVGKGDSSISAVGTTECEKEKDKSKTEEIRSKKESVADDGQEKGKNVSKTIECSNVESRRSDDVKMRRDNLDKLLCLNINLQESPQKHGELVLGIGRDSTSIMNPSFVELSMSNELEQKKRRTIDKLKGTKNLGGRLSVGRKTPLSQSQSLISPSETENGDSPTQSELTDKVVHLSDPEQSKLEDDEEDCPTLRLSDGEDATSPCKRIVPSPSAFELLDSVEERIALLHAEIKSPTMKKTARMSCSPHSLKKDSLQTSPKNVPEKGKSDVTCEKESSCSSQKVPKAAIIKNKQLASMEIDAIPSTSKASERMHRAAERIRMAAERKLSKQNALSEDSSRSCHITFRKRTDVNGTEFKKNKTTSSVLQVCSLNQVILNSTENKDIQRSSKPPESSEKSPENNRSIAVFDVEPSDTQEKCNHRGKEAEAEEWSKRDSRRKNKSSLSDSATALIIPEENERQKESVVSKTDGSVSSKSPKVPIEGKSDDLKARSSCLDKPCFEVSKEISEIGMHFTHSNEEETKNKNNNIMKRLRCTAVNRLFEEAVESINKAVQGSSTKPSHSQSDKLHTCASKCDENCATREQTSEINKVVDHSEIKANINLTSDVTSDLTRINIKCLREPVELALESVVAKQRDALEDKITKGDLEHRKQIVEKNSGRHRTLSRDSLEKTGKLEEGAHPSYVKQKASSKKESEMQSSYSLVENSSHMSENKKSRIGNRSNKSDIHDESSISLELREEKMGDGCSSKLQSNTGVLSENSALAKSVYVSDHSSKKIKSTINEEQCNGFEHFNNVVESVVPPCVSEISFELDEGIVRLTMSPYIELLSYRNHEKVGEMNKGGNGEGRRIVTPQVALHDKGGAFGEHSSTRKRKHSYLFNTEVQGSKDGLPSKVTMSVKENSRKESNVRRNNSDESKVKKVLEILNNPSPGLGSVDDDSLFTYTVLGCIDSEEMNAKEEEESERILPLKKRRTTTEEAPVKFQPDGVDGPHGNTGIISQLKTMEIEDFLSKVHGNGS